MKFVFDLDGTLTKSETLPIIAAAFHMEKEINALTAQTIRGDVPFMEGFIRRVNLLAHIDVKEIASVLAEVEIDQTMLEFIEENKEDCVVATGNFQGWIERLCKKIPCEVQSSEGAVDDNGQVRLNKILKKEDLVRAYQAKGEQVVFIGDGNNDAEAMRIADVSIACGIVHKPARSVMQVANYAVYEATALIRLLNQIKIPQRGTSIVVSAAGVGSRLGLGQTKSLIRIAEKSLIQTQLEHFREVEDIRVVVGFQAQSLIDEAITYRKDLIFVFNHDYFHTRTGASLSLGARHANEWVIAWDGDLLVHPDDIADCLSTGEEFVCVSEKASQDTVFVKLDDAQRVVAFTRDEGDYEWSGPACIRRSNIRFTSGHVYSQLEPLLPLPIKVIRARDIDTYDDYRNALEFVKSWDRGNSKIHAYYEKLSGKIKHPSETRNKTPDFSRFDVEFVRNFAGKQKTMLDLGSGTGLLINPLANAFKNITAVEKYPKFSQFISKSETIKIVEDDIKTFQTIERYDLITIFGVMNFFNSAEAQEIYTKVINWLKNDGTLIIKHQMGKREDVIVDGYSEELETDYYSEYRWVSNEIKILRAAGFMIESTTDIYPPEFNRWDNTHFYALTCKLQKPMR